MNCDHLLLFRHEVYIYHLRKQFRVKWCDSSYPFIKIVHMLPLSYQFSSFIYLQIYYLMYLESKKVSSLTWTMLLNSTRTLLKRSEATLGDMCFWWRKPLKNLFQTTKKEKPSQKMLWTFTLNTGIIIFYCRIFFNWKIIWFYLNPLILCSDKK